MNRSNSDVYLPNDVVNEILLRLPVKSLGRCKCVCRIWKNLIQNPNFIKNHYHHPRNPTRLFAAFSNTWMNTAYKFSLFNSESLSLLEEIPNPIIANSEEWKLTDAILGPVNGLYFMSYSSFNLNHTSKVVFRVLWNPSIHEFRELPSHPSLINGSRYFGFGSTGDDIDDIKVISVKSFCGVDDMSSSVMIGLYSLKHDSWKNLEYNSARFPFICNGVHLLSNYRFNHVNGVYYWLTMDYDILFLFDMKKEEFREVTLPILYSNSHRYGPEDIFVRDNSSVVLFVYLRPRSDVVSASVDVWEMKEEGQWIKLFSFSNWLDNFVFGSDVIYFGFWKKDEIVVRTKDKKVFLYNINSHETRNLEIKYWSNRIIVSNYKESIYSFGIQKLASETHSILRTASESAKDM